MILRTDQTYQITANAHDATECQQADDSGSWWALAIDRFAELANQGIEKTEHKQTFNIPHVANLQFSWQHVQQSTHHQQGYAQAYQFLLDKYRGSLFIVTRRDKIARDQKEQSHEEGGVYWEEMPYPRHHLGRITGRIGPASTITVCLTSMVEYHQHRQAYFQIVQI